MTEKILSLSKLFSGILYILGIFVSYGSQKEQNTHFFEMFLDNETLAKNYIYGKEELCLPLLDAWTFGIFRLPAEIIFLLIFNNTPFIANNDELKTYAHLEQQRLYHFLNKMENNNASQDDSIAKIYALLYGKDFDIIRDIAIDYSVYGGKNSIFKKNFYILEDYINNFIFQKLTNLLIKDKAKISSYSYLGQSYAMLYSLNFKLNSYIARLLIDAINPSLHFLTTAGDTKNLLKKFKNENFAKLMQIQKNIQNFIEELEANQDPLILEPKIQKKINDLNNNPLLKQILNQSEFDKQIKILEEQKTNVKQESDKYKIKYESLQLVQEYGIFLPFDLFFKKYFGIVYTTFMSMGSWTHSLIKKTLFKTNHTEINFDDFKKKHFSNWNNFDTDVAIIQEMTSNNKIMQIRRIRNKLFVEQGKMALLKHRGLLLYISIMSYTRNILENILEQELEGVATSIFVYLTSKTINVTPIFPEEVLINSRNNEKLEMFIKCAQKNIVMNRPIPHIIFQINNDHMQRSIREIIYAIFRNNRKKSIVFHCKKIINPISITRFLTKIKMASDGQKNNLNSNKVIQVIFQNNIKNFKKLLETYFIGEKYAYLSWFNQILMQSTWIVGKVEKYTLNINTLNSKLVTLLEVEAMEYLCGVRNTKNNTPYSLCSLIYMELVNNMVRDVLIIAYTSSLSRIDRAVLSRIPFHVEFKNEQELDDYIIIVKRHLLELFKIENFIDLEGSTFEEALWLLARFLYSNNYDMELVQKILINFKNPKIQKIYGGRLKINDIIKVMKNGIEGTI